ncbi:MAG: hypothetical protein KDI19_09820, partial [Pseudomonadales bacterium]|nr:hypothetical protein [Pseudomonadales bacterium]
KRPDLSCYASKPVLVSSASPGAFGGMRAASHLRTLLAGIGCLVFPQIFVVPSALQAFSEDGSFANETLSERADQIAGAFVQLVDKLS